MSDESVCVSTSGGISSSDTCALNPSQSWILNSYRPRGSLARALYEKQIFDNYLETFDKSLMVPIEHRIAAWGKKQLIKMKETHLLKERKRGEKKRKNIGLLIDSKQLKDKWISREMPERKKPSIKIN
ncbi:hypothetical protein FQA39_LY07554 [Lamprigera yunnana]|nr:hypothetical protein FQA39_LY07554 [Lamprigera yunnana]